MRDPPNSPRSLWLAQYGGYEPKAPFGGGLAVDAAADAGEAVDRAAIRADIADRRGEVGRDRAGAALVPERLL
jgi:hypothetical protein